MKMSEENIIGNLNTSASAIAVEWKIDKFFSRSSDRYPWISEDFYFSGATWCFNMYPGKGSGNQLIGLYLRRKTIITAGHHVSFEIGIRKCDETKNMCRKITHIFTSEKGIRGWYDFADMQKIQKEKDVFVPNDVLTICFSAHLEANHHEEGVQTASSRIDINENNKNEKEDREAYNEVDINENKKNEKEDREAYNEVDINENEKEDREAYNEDVDSLIENFTELFLKEMFYDVTIKVKEREFGVHKSILGARSPVFAAMFQHNMKEKQCNVVNIIDCDPDAFKVFLFYLYSAKLDEITSENVVSLYSIADKYQMQQLVDHCAHFILNNLSVDNICDVLDLALKHGEKLIKEAAEKFFLNNMSKILSTLKWQLFMKENNTVANELFLKFSERVTVE